MISWRDTFISRLEYLISVQEINNQKSVQDATITVISRMKSLTSAPNRRFLRSTAGNRPLVQTLYQVVFSMRPRSELERTLQHLVVNHALASEKAGPGSLERFLCLLEEQLTGGFLPPIPDAHVPTDEQLHKILERTGTTGGSIALGLLRNAVTLAGFAGRIIIEKTMSSVPSVELVRGYSFNLEQLLPIDFSFLRARICCIDGYIESVSEIHHLLEEASEVKEPCVLFVRGVSDDVRHTLKVNYDRGSLRVVPVGVRFDLEGMNTLVDLAVVSGCDVVSHLKGQLISNVRLSEMPFVEQLTMFKGRTVVFNSSTASSVATHRQRLRDRRTEEQVDDVARLLDARIRSVCPTQVVIRLPDDKDFVLNSQAIDLGLRTLRSAIDHGVDLKGSPISGELAAQTYSMRCARSLCELGSCLA